MKIERVDPVPDELTARSGFDRADYADCFTVATDLAGSATGEEWARATVEGAARAGRFLAWEVACGLRLGSMTSPELVGGWRVGASEDSWARLEATGARLTAHMVFAADVTTVSFATFVRYESGVGRVLWPRISAVHRHVAPGFLGSAVRRIRSSGRPS